MRNHLRAGFVGLLTIVGVVAFSSSALGVKWKSASDPLYGYEDGARFGKTYGDFFNQGGVKAKSSTWQADLQPGGNNVRVETDFYFKENGGAGCTSSCWNLDTSKQTNETDSSAWFYDYRTEPLHGLAEGARGGMNICEIQAWQNDPCSAHAWATFYY